MPAVAGNGPHGGDEGLGSSDEVKVFKDEGEDEQEQNASESLQAELLEEKSSLITESELNGKTGDIRRPEAGHPFSVPGFPNPFGVGYFVNPYAAYANGAAQLGRGSSPLSPFLPEPLGSPPPAHMAGLPRPGPLGYPPTLQYPYSSLGMEQLAAWHSQMYAAQQHQSRAAAGANYPGLSPFYSSAGGSPGNPMHRFSPHLHPSAHHPGLPHPWGLPGHHLPHLKSEYDRPPHLIHPDDKDVHHSSPKKKEPHIKKPLNAFMLYMKEMRPVVQAECTLKESAAINQILGRRWHGLTREEQAKYYEKARIERQRHMQMYPHWNARDNYRFGQKKKKRKRDKQEDPAANMKKCRARYGLDQQNLWCKPCRRKKKCIRVQMYLAGRSEQEIEATTFDEDGEAITPTGLPPTQPNITNSCSSNGSDGEGGSPASQGGSVDSDSASIKSPATPSGGPLSVPSLGSPAGSIASPLTPGGGCNEDWFRGSGGYRPPNHRPVGTDPRDSKNPLSISSLTGSCHTSGREGPAGNVPSHMPSLHHQTGGHREKLQLGVT